MAERLNLDVTRFCTEAAGASLALDSGVDFLNVYRYPVSVSS
jgi:hypothetical protein